MHFACMYVYIYIYIIFIIIYYNTCKIACKSLKNVYKKVCNACVSCT